MTDEMLLQQYLERGLSGKLLQEIEEKICSDPHSADELLLIAADELSLQKWSELRAGNKHQRNDYRFESAVVCRLYCSAALLLVTIFLLLVEPFLIWNQQRFLAEIVVCSSGAIWKQEDNPTAEVTSLPVGKIFHLKKGKIELRMPTGARALIAAPATFQVTGKNELFLKQGVLLAEVPTQQAKGFTVLTPTSKNIDHGTIFGVIVNKAGTTRTQVFQGKVESHNTKNNNALTRTMLRTGEGIFHSPTGKVQPLAEDYTENFYALFGENQAGAPPFNQVMTSSPEKGIPMLHRVKQLLKITTTPSRTSMRRRQRNMQSIIADIDVLESRELLAGAPTDLAIGGGSYYSNIVSSGNITISSNSVSAFRTAVENASSGDVVFINSNITIDLTSEATLLVPAGVTIASDRGQNGSKGALLYKSDHNSTPIFTANGDDVRFTGFRLKGPDEFMFLSSKGHVSRGIINNGYDNLEVDNMELYNFSHAGVYLKDGANAQIHHSSIHDNLSDGLGYGVVLVGSANNVTIEYNLFDQNRHSIAGSGDPALNGNPGQSYIARYNIVFAHANSHAFDMHGYNERFSKTGNPLPDSDPNKKAAGERIDIYDNTFIIAGSAAVVIRGVPTNGAYIYNNKFINPDASFSYNGSAILLNGAIVQKFYFQKLYLDANGTVELTTTTTIPSGDTNAYGQNDDFLYGDFETNDDRRNDVFWATGDVGVGNPYNKRWFVSIDGTEAWKLLNASAVPIDQLVLQDFNGNGISDVYRSITGEVSTDGTGSWTLLSSVTGLAGALSDRAFGDYNGDGKADVFKKEVNPAGTDWLKVSYGGTQNWVTAIGTNVSLSELMFVDLGSDKTTDIVTRSGSKFRVSRGKGNLNSNYSWQDVTHRSFEHDGYFYGDFDGNGKTDQFQINGGNWQVRYDGSSNFVNYNTNVTTEEDTLTELGLGDFDGDGKVEIFKRVPSTTAWKYWDSDTSVWKNLASSGVALSRYEFGDFDGNGITDVIYKTGSEIKVSWDSRKGWERLALTSESYSNLQFFDATGDSYTDIMLPKSYGIRISHNSQQTWVDWDPADSQGLRSNGSQIRDSDAVELKAEQLTRAVREAKRRWGLAGADVSLLKSINYTIADLGGNLLGQAAGNQITIDTNAAGYGWYVDRNMRSDSEFRRFRKPQGMDLLTVVMHEMGHVLGYGHDDPNDGIATLMDHTLDVGQRRSPGIVNYGFGIDENDSLTTTHKGWWKWLSRFNSKAKAIS